MLLRHDFLGLSEGLGVAAEEEHCRARGFVHHRMPLYAMYTFISSSSYSGLERFAGYSDFIEVYLTL